MTAEQKYKKVIESEKYQYVVTFIVFIISITLMLLNLFVVKVPCRVNGGKTLVYLRLYNEKNMFLPFSLFMLFPTFTMIFQMLEIRFISCILLILRWVVVVFSFVAIFPFLLGVGGGIAVIYLILIAFIINGFGFLFCKVVVYFYISCMLDGQIFNKNYNGTPPISRKGKILEVLIQLILLPVSVAINVYVLTIIGTYPVGMFVKHVFYLHLKKEDDEAVTYYVEPSDKVVTETERQEIYNDIGTKVGEIRVEKKHVVHDDGKRTDDPQILKAILHSIFFLPLRVLSFLLSIVAVFVPKMYVKIYKISKINKCAYDHQLFKYLDLIVFKQ